MPYSRILVILKGYLGDAVMVTPLLAGLSGHPGYEVHVLTEPAVIDLLEDTVPRVTFHSLTRLGKVVGIRQDAKEMGRLHFDLAICVNRSFRAALIAALANIPVRVGHATDARSWLLTKSIRYDRQRSEFESYLDLARLASIELESSLPTLKPKASLVPEATAKLEGADVGIQPGARHEWKEIPRGVLREVARTLQAEGHKLALLGGPEECAQGQELTDQLDQKPVNLIGKLSLKESVAAVSQLKLMIGGDTGLMHIAAAAGCPTVTSFGRAPATKWGHAYPPHEVLVAPEGQLAEIGAQDYLDAARRALGAR